MAPRIRFSRARGLVTAVVLMFSVPALGAGCEAEAPLPAPEVEAKEPAAAPPTTSPDLPPSQELTLAMADPGGSATVDGDVRAAQLWVKRVPKSNDKLIELGRAWVQKARHSGDPGFYLNAKACGDLVTAREPSNHLARELYAQVMLNQHQFAEAKDMCEQVFVRDPESLPALATYVDTLFELGRMDEAVRAADKLVELKPNLASYMRVSYFQWLKGDLKGALASAKLGIRSSNDPSRPEPKAYALVQTANYFFLQGDYDGADAGYRDAASEHADYPPALVGRGKVALAKGDPARAAELFSLAFKAIPLVDTVWRLGDARLAAGDEKGAEEAYREVVKLGRSTDARTLAHFYAVKNRDVEEALKLAEQEMKLRPGLYTADVYAWALYRNGRFKEAQTAIDQALSFGTKDPGLLYHAGAIAIANGDKPGGMRKIKAALARSPKFDWSGAAEAEKLLASLKEG